MRLRLLSDLHMEGNIFYYEYAGEDIAILAGDIHTQNRHRFILDQIPQNVKVLFVTGNHEYYSGTFEYVNEFFYDLQSEYTNFTFLENENIIINDVDFFGGTMFTDFSLYNDVWEAKQFAKNGIADFHWIDKLDNNGETRRWNPQDHIYQHELFKQKLDMWLNNSKAKKKVVISHFVPSVQCISPRFVGSRLNPYFTVDMSEFNGKVDAWLFGHTHDAYDIKIGGTRYVCNPRGYTSEFGSNGFNPNLIIEV